MSIITELNGMRRSAQVTGKPMPATYAITEDERAGAAVELREMLKRQNGQQMSVDEVAAALDYGVVKVMGVRVMVGKILCA